VRALLAGLLAYFLNPVGLVVLGILDSSLIFFLPLGIDFVLIVMAARRPELFWVFALAATAGSLIGAAGTYWLGHKVGEPGLAKLLGPSQLKRVQQRVSRSAAPAIASLAIIPPPFPFTALVLTSGAVGLNVWRFFSTLAAVRLFRFGLEAALAARYGRRLLVWMESTTFEIAVGVFITLALVGTAVSAAIVVRKARRPRPAN
jgi:membrane protein YqaA with SNARE-associated domain